MHRTAETLCEQLRSLKAKTKGGLKGASAVELEGLVNPVIEDLRQQEELPCAETLETLLATITGRGTPETGQVRPPRQPATAAPPAPSQTQNRLTVGLAGFRDRTCVDCPTELAGQMSRDLEAVLQETGDFRPVTDAAFLKNRNSTAFSISNIDLQRLKAVGARLVITGVYEVSGSTFTLEMHCWDVHRGKLAAKASYEGRLKSYPGMLRDFLGEINSYLGSRG